MFLLSILVLLLPSSFVSANHAPKQARDILPINAFGVAGQNATYDYIVVGGGTAGLTIAARLAENSSVAVIEAGSFYEIDSGNLSVVPGFTFLGSGADLNDTLPLVDWNFATTPQAGANNRSLHYARGKTLGGSSARNYMAYLRGIRTLIRYQVGDDSYTFDNLLPFFKRSVNFTGPNFSKRFANSTLNYDPSVFDDSFQGPLQVSYANYASPLASWAQLAFSAIGISLNNGFNSGSLFGSMWSTSTIDPTTSHRSSSETSFLDHDLLQTAGLKVYTHTLAKQILFDEEKNANGVLVSTTEEGITIPFTLSAAKEIILSAGSFQSPQLLMVSGVGPSETLQKYDIPILSDLSGVGQNMWDHVLFGSAFRVNVLTSSEIILNPQYAAEITEEYLFNQSGPLTGFGYLAFEKLPASSNLAAATNASLAQFPADWPNVEYLTGDAYMGLNRNFMTSDPHDGYQYATLDSCLVSPLSRGNVTINSTDTADPPLINPNWLTHPADAEVAIAGFKRGREIWANMENVTIGEEYLPGPSVQTDAQILEFIRDSCIQLYHAAATCAMGKIGDPNAVVDSQARVFGVQGLRVVDASAFPLLPPGHPQATVYALAEKIADDIKKGQ